MRPTCAWHSMRNGGEVCRAPRQLWIDWGAARLFKCFPSVRYGLWKSRIRLTTIQPHECCTENVRPDRRGPGPVKRSLYKWFGPLQERSSAACSRRLGLMSARRGCAKWRVPINYRTINWRHALQMERSSPRFHGISTNSNISTSSNMSNNVQYTNKSLTTAVKAVSCGKILINWRF